MTEPSGVAWCDRYPTSRSTADLVEPFRSGVEQFVTALELAGARVAIAATRRPRERAYLMRQAWDISRGLNVRLVPSLPGVEIDWTHGGDDRAARAAAVAMVGRYGLAYQPSLTSRHIEGLAIDMTITWMKVMRVFDANRCAVDLDWSGDRARLYEVGASYGVVKLVSDPPHWSSDGR